MPPEMPEYEAVPHQEDPLLTLGAEMAALAASFADGLKAALHLRSTLAVFGNSPTVVTRTSQCVLLNGVFLASIWVSEQWLIPFIHDTGPLFGIPADTSTLGVWSRTTLAWLDTVMSLLFQVFWFLPFYLISLILTTVWFSDIASHAFVAHYKRKPSAIASITGMISEELYRLIVMAVLMAFVAIASFLPYIGQPIGFVITCFIYSFYSFEYVWGMQSVDFVSRVRRIEIAWPYYLGFGLPCTAAAFFGSRFVNAAAYATVFPFCLILAVTASPPALDKPIGVLCHACHYSPCPREWPWWC